MGLYRAARQRSVGDDRYGSAPHDSDHQPGDAPAAGQPGIAGLGTVTPGSFTSGVAGGGAEFPGNGAYGGMQAGDFVGNIRLDQTWGSAQVMAAAHELNPTYYASTAGAGGTAPANATPGAGHPSDQWGYAVGAGLRLNFPMIAQGDYFQSQVNYTQGALRYLFFTPNSNWGKVEGNNETFGVLSDCVYGGAPGIAATATTGCQLTTAWGFNASYEHYWTPSVHESFFGGYYAVSYNQVPAAPIPCSAPWKAMVQVSVPVLLPARAATTTGRPLSSVAGCNGMSPSRSILVSKASTTTWTAPRSLPSGRHSGRFAAGVWRSHRRRAARERVDGQRPYAQGLPALIV